MNFKKKLERYLRVNLLGPGPRLIKKEFTGPAVSLRLRNTALGYKHTHSLRHSEYVILIAFPRQQWLHELVPK